MRRGGRDIVPPALAQLMVKPGEIVKLPLNDSDPHALEKVFVRKLIWFEPPLN